MFGLDRFDDWKTPVVVRVIVCLMRFSEVCPRSQPLEHVTALFSGSSPRRDCYCSWVSCFLSGLVIPRDEGIEVGFLVFHKSSDLNIGEVVSTRTFPDRE